MKVLILGTSNSILKGGWVDGFKSAFPGAEIHNASAGASPGFQFLPWLHRDLGAYDTVFFDSIVNDENLGRYVGAPELYHRLLFELVSSLAARTRLIVLGFSARQFLNEDSPQYQRRRAMTDHLGAEFVGFHDIVRARQQELRNRHGAVYQEAPHYHSAISFALGAALARALQDGVRTARPPEAQDFAPFYQVADFNNAGFDPVVTRRNAFTKATFTHFREGARIPLDPSKRVVGLLVNALQTSCTLRLHPPSGAALDLFLGYKVTPDKLMKKFVPVPDLAQASALEILAQTSPRLAPHATENLDRPGEAHLELAEIVQRDPFPNGIPPTPTATPGQPCALHQATERYFGAGSQE